jgi:hypothetical protein
MLVSGSPLDSVDGPSVGGGGSDVWENDGNVKLESGPAHPPNDSRPVVSLNGAAQVVLILPYKADQKPTVPVVLDD